AESGANCHSDRAECHKDGLADANRRLSSLERLLFQFVSQSQTQPQSASGSAPVPPVGVDDISHWFDAPDLGPDFLAQLTPHGGGNDDGYVHP
ncbi:hypothetical protein LINPERPRIM_LOCUS31246, partial [Linum perenne]